MSVYKRLGGVLDEFPAQPRGWDIQFDGWAIELDEEQHFNRYRLVTLSSPLYDLIPAFQRRLYSRFCVEYEAECIVCTGKRRGYWSKPEADRQFGLSGEIGVLDAAGSSRWRQRAFYDFLRDLAPLVLGIEVTRISVWEQMSVRGRPSTIGEMLKSQDLSALSSLSQHLLSRRSAAGVLS